jgi:hypothetical protein
MLKPERAVQESCISANRVGWVSQYLFFFFFFFFVFFNTYFLFLVMQHSWRGRVILTSIQPHHSLVATSLSDQKLTVSFVSLEEPQKNTEVSERRALPVYVTSEGYLLLVYYVLECLVIFITTQETLEKTLLTSKAAFCLNLSLSLFF